MDIFPVASTTAILATLGTNVGLIMGLVLGAVLIAATALVGIGFGWRKTTKHVTGKKF